jgi:hypothetical protein
VPEDPEAIVRELAEQAPMPEEAAQRLAERRVSVTRQHLVDVAGIPAERLIDAGLGTPPSRQATGGVEFRLRPAS